MKITPAYIESQCRKACIVSPLTMGKLLQVFGDKPEVMKEAFDMLCKGQLDGYKMIPGGGDMSF